MRTVRGAVRSGWSARQRLLVEDVEPGAADGAAAQRCQQCLLVDDRAAARVDQRSSVGFICASSWWPTRSRVRSESTRWTVTTSAVANSSSLLDAPDADLSGSLVGEVLAPRDDVHAERLPDPGDPLPQPPEPDDAEGGAREVGADGLLPAAGADGGVLLREVAGDGEDQRPGELDGAGGVRGGAADGDAALGGGRDVDGGVAAAGGDEQPEVRQPLEQGARERRPLAHGDDDVERRQPLDERVLVVEVVGELDDVDGLGDAGPVGEAGGDGLVVVEDGDAVHGVGLLHANGPAPPDVCPGASGPSTGGSVVGAGLGAPGAAPLRFACIWATKSLIFCWFCGLRASWITFAATADVRTFLNMPAMVGLLDGRLTS